MTEKWELQFVGLSREDEIDKSAAETLAGKSAEKIAGLIPNTLKLTVHVKTSSRTDGRKKYHVTSRVNSPGIFLEAKEEGWIFIQALEKSLKVLITEVKKKTRKT
jgi:hypothetical protein